MYLYNVIVGSQDANGTVKDIKCLGIFASKQEACAVARKANETTPGITWAEVYSSNKNRLVLAMRLQVHKWVNVTKQIA